MLEAVRQLSARTLYSHKDTVHRVTYGSWFMKDFRRDVCLLAAMLLGTGIYDTANLAEASAHSTSILDLTKLTVAMNDESTKGKMGCYVTVVKDVINGVLTMRAVRVGKVGVSEKIVSWVESIDGLGVTERIDLALNENVGREKIDEAFEDGKREPDTLGGFLSCADVHNDAMDPAPEEIGMGSFDEVEDLEAFLNGVDWESTESTVTESESAPESTASEPIDGNEGSKVRKTAPHWNI